MEPTKARKRGRPYGGIAFIISKSVAFKTSKHCLYILLNQHNIVMNNVYRPANDTRRSTEENEEATLEAVGHLNAAHCVDGEILDGITIGDFNFSPEDLTTRSKIITDFLLSRNYGLQCDLANRASNEHTHDSGRTLDRICFTRSIRHILNSCRVIRSYVNSDHFLVVAEIALDNEAYSEPAKTKYLCWDKASDKALLLF